MSKKSKKWQMFLFNSLTSIKHSTIVLKMEGQGIGAGGLSYQAVVLSIICIFITRTTGRLRGVIWSLTKCSLRKTDHHYKFVKMELKYCNCYALLIKISQWIIQIYVRFIPPMFANTNTPFEINGIRNILNALTNS